MSTGGQREEEGKKKKDDDDDDGCGMQVFYLLSFVLGREPKRRGRIDKCARLFCAEGETFETKRQTIKKIENAAAA